MLVRSGKEVKLSEVIKLIVSKIGIDWIEEMINGIPKSIILNKIQSMFIESIKLFIDIIK